MGYGALKRAKTKAYTAPALILGLRLRAQCFYQSPTNVDLKASSEDAVKSAAG